MIRTVKLSLEMVLLKVILLGTLWLPLISWLLSFFSCGNLPPMFSFLYFLSFLLYLIHGSLQLILCLLPISVFFSQCFGRFSLLPSPIFSIKCFNAIIFLIAKMSYLWLFLFMTINSCFTTAAFPQLMAKELDFRTPECLSH